MVCHRARYSEMASDLNEFRAHLLHGAREMPELKLWQLQGEVRVKNGRLKLHVLMNKRFGIPSCSEGNECRC